MALCRIEHVSRQNDGPRAVTLAQSPGGLQGEARRVTVLPRKCVQFPTSLPSCSPLHPSTLMLESLPPSHPRSYVSPGAITQLLELEPLPSSPSAPTLFPLAEAFSTVRRARHPPPPTALPQHRAPRTYPRKGLDATLGTS
jgi:hypothetical protein